MINFVKSLKLINQNVFNFLIWAPLCALPIIFYIFNYSESYLYLVFNKNI